MTRWLLVAFVLGAHSHHARGDRVILAHHSGDLGLLERAVRRVGPSHVGDMLRSGNRDAILAALAATPFCPESFRLLPSLAHVAATGDRGLAAPAGHRAARAAAQLDAATAMEHEVSQDFLRTTRDSWLMLARTGDRWLEVRVAALRVAAAIDLLLVGDDIDWPELFADTDFEFRRAAVELAPFPPRPNQRAALVALVLNDRDGHVVLAALQGLCAPSATHPLLRRELNDAAWTRTRALVADASYDLVARGGAARCLRNDPSPQGKRIVARLRGQLPRGLRRWLAR